MILVNFFGILNTSVVAFSQVIISIISIIVYLTKWSAQLNI